MHSEIEQSMVEDAKAAEHVEVAGRGISAKDRANARRWLRRHGYGHLTPGYVAPSAELRAC